jgi:hypothetical protein
MRHALDAMAGDSNQPLCVAVAAGIMRAWVPFRVAALVAAETTATTTALKRNDALSAAGPNKRMKLTKRGILVGRCPRWALLH